MPRHTYSPSLSPTSNRRSRSHSRSRSLSTDLRHRRHRSPSPTGSDNGKNLLKTSMVFLGVVGAATIAASKFWPKGILYGEKESWAQEAKQEIKHAMGGGKSDDRASQRRARSVGPSERDSRSRRPHKLQVRDEVVVMRPDGHATYMDTGWVPRSSGDGTDRNRRRHLGCRDSRRFDAESYGSGGLRDS
ncbi:hypothetical protein GGS26DRAFT_484463 [Hypomontagnella submonticulosa]|nr:hypothetical protein GGS26DRAFT_484463 [Hypomontagnella submonticulosa]